MIDVKLWLPEEEIDATAWAQIDAVRNHPYATSHLAIMPDCHGGYGVPIGAVFATKDMIIPNAVGVDIACGMLIEALTGVFVDDEKAWLAFAEAVREKVPTGNGEKGNRQDDYERNTHFIRSDFTEEFLDQYPNILETSKRQLGTLGGGNHFLEVLTDDNGLVYFMVHSGSRGVGAKIAEFYHRKAISQLTSGIPKDLAGLRRDTLEYDQYYRLHQKTISYANRSRQNMLTAMRSAYAQTINKYKAKPEGNIYQVQNLHNFVEVVGNAALHRKGATPAATGLLGIIPGSMGTSTYIVRGKGNVDSHKSASHGSGRTYGRAAAKREFTVEQFKDALSGTYSSPKEQNLDESPMAYKDIEIVMDRQKDLVEIVRKLRPVITIKA